jgi:hypothetical protein
MRCTIARPTPALVFFGAVQPLEYAKPLAGVLHVKAHAIIFDRVDLFAILFCAADLDASDGPFEWPAAQSRKNKPSIKRPICRALSRMTCRCRTASGESCNSRLLDDAAQLEFALAQRFLGLLAFVDFSL